MTTEDTSSDQKPYQLYDGKKWHAH